MNIGPVACKTSKAGTNVCQIPIKLYQKLPKDLQNFAKVAKFRQIWSHCQLLTYSKGILADFQEQSIKRLI